MSPAALRREIAVHHAALAELYAELAKIEGDEAERTIPDVAPPFAVGEKLLRIKDIAKLMGCDPSTASRRVRAAEIGIMCGGDVLIPESRIGALFVTRRRTDRTDCMSHTKTRVAK